MRIRSIHSLTENDRLAKAIYNENGQILLKKGVTPTSGMITRLKKKGISYVYIEDELTEGIVVSDAIGEKTRAQSLKTIQSSFQSMSDKLVLGKSIDMDKFTPAFSNVIKNILSEVKANGEAISMLSDVFCYDSYIFHHSLNVAVYALALGRKYGLMEKELEELGLGAILHDVGKISIPVEVLNKQDKLTDEEFCLIKEHSTVGFEMLRKSHTISMVTAHCAFQHHERLDGSGYPRGIKGKDIHLYAKLIGLVDVFDAVTANRVYRKAMLPHEGLELLYSGADTKFEKEMIQAFAKTVAIYPLGLEVRLSDGRIGIVAKQNNNISSRPVVRIITEEENMVTPYEINLEEHLDVMIVSCENCLSQHAAS
ncbi:HDIG domain-containing protein [Evansella caseinilytica]|uniref:HDIG domain-containing protein n=1 Tax=Evansella caseinilytica TaxID=1503961 RepID=A0A1H3UCS4_9BACI|nr:HD-GYP domain-containing protein [Evansella caseinilytica]SDZ60146.1 HDIG domain-containing protein [Evansella caseinilytica]